MNYDLANSQFQRMLSAILGIIIKFTAHGSMAFRTATKQVLTLFQLY